MKKSRNWRARNTPATSSASWTFIWQPKVSARCGRPPKSHFSCA